ETLRMYVDYEFNSRLHGYGERLLLVPHIRVRHHHRTSIGSYAKHELQRGRAAVMLRRSGLLPGGWAVRSRLLCSLVAPAMMARRAMADIGRIASSKIIPTIKLAAVAPSFAIGTICWGAGFLIEGLNPDYLRIDRNHRGPSFRTK
ncbi:MAG: hypothetical protein Q7N50_15360, partial [Armatimonadota bacterium]|nr:hypothetical protein [Armatimonadota bacterium]